VGNALDDLAIQCVLCYVKKLALCSNARKTDMCTAIGNLQNFASQALDIIFPSHILGSSQEKLKAGGGFTIEACICYTTN